MKVCKIEDFPGDKLECKNCPHYLLNYNVCKLAQSRIKELQECLCPSEGCREDCHLMPCEGIAKDLEKIRMETHETLYNVSPDSIKFIKACEEVECI